MYGPKHLVYQLFGKGRGELDIREYIQTFSFLIESWSVNLDMYGLKHSVFPLSPGVGTFICMDPNIQFFH